MWENQNTASDGKSDHDVDAASEKRESGREQKAWKREKKHGMKFEAHAANIVHIVITLPTAAGDTEENCE